MLPPPWSNVGFANERGELHPLVQNPFNAGDADASAALYEEHAVLVVPRRTGLS